MSEENKRGGYFFRLSIGFDQFVNVIFGGDPDETISAKCHRKRNDSKYWNGLRVIVNTIFFWQNDHCRGAYNVIMNGGYRSNHYNQCNKK